MRAGRSDRRQVLGALAAPHGAPHAAAREPQLLQALQAPAAEQQQPPPPLRQDQHRQGVELTGGKAADAAGERSECAGAAADHYTGCGLVGSGRPCAMIASSTAPKT